MSQTRLLCLTVFIAFLVLLTSCGSKKDSASLQEPLADAEAMGNAESLDSKSVGILEGRTTGPMLPIYFHFDSYGLRSDQHSRLKVNADYLKKNTSVKIRVEGNCDPRGTREYNLGLGEKRAISAKKYLINMGVDAARISTVSLGEEKILFHGHDEMAWAQNRRDDFVVE